MFIAVATILGIGGIAYVGQRALFESNKEQSEYQEQGLARDIAKSGLDRTVSEIKRKLMGAEATRQGVNIAQGEFASDVSSNGYGDLDVTISSENGDVENVIEANIIFETPLESAIVLLAERVEANGTGTYAISGLDRRAPSVANTRGYLQPTVAITTDTDDNLIRLSSGLDGSRVIGLEGQSSWVSGSANGQYESLYTEAMSHASVQEISAPFTGSYGTMDDPAILHVTGNFNPTSSFSGKGMLIVDDGHFNVDSHFDWEGLVLVRKMNVDSISINLASGAGIYGGLISYELPGAAPEAEECDVVPFILDGLYTIPTVPVDVTFTVLGAAISYGGSYDMPVTSRVHVGGDYAEPWVLITVRWKETLISMIRYPRMRHQRQ